MIKDLKTSNLSINYDGNDSPTIYENSFNHESTLLSLPVIRVKSTVNYANYF